MIRATWSIRLERPPEEIFAYIADLHNEPRWNPGASNVVQKSAGPVGLGTVFEEDFKGVGHYVTTVDRFEPSSELGFDARNPKTDALVRFHLTPAGESATQVSCEVQLTMKGVMRFAEPLLRPMIRKQIEKSRPAGLRAALESPAA